MIRGAASDANTNCSQVSGPQIPNILHR